MEKSILKVGADVRYRIADPIAMHTLIKDVDHSLRVSGHTALSTQLSGQKLNFIQTEKSLIQLKLLVSFLFFTDLLFLLKNLLKCWKF